VLLKTVNFAINGRLGMPFLGVFANSIANGHCNVMSVCLSPALYRAAPTGRFIEKFHIRDFLLKNVFIFRWFFFKSEKIADSFRGDVCIVGVSFLCN
jgi:hypothetical protein